MKKISLTQGKFAIVDDEDYEKLIKYKWYYNSSLGYPIRSEKYNKIYMHKDLMFAAVGMEVDHKNGNKFDNRRCNLRIATKHQNRLNKGLIKRNTSGYVGVSWVENRKKWDARVCFNRKIYTLGLFINKIDAVIARDKKARELHGEFAFLNLNF